MLARRSAATLGALLLATAWGGCAHEARVIARDTCQAFDLRCWKSTTIPTSADFCAESRGKKYECAIACARDVNRSCLICACAPMGPNLPPPGLALAPMGYRPEDGEPFPW